MPVQNAADVTHLHASLGPVPELLEQRRAVYSAAIELFRGAAAADVPDSVLDNPAVRAHLGAVLGGTAEVDPAQLMAVDALTAPRATFRVSTSTVRVASSPAAPGALAPAVALITGQLQMHGDEAGPRILTEADREFAPALAAVRQGVELAMRLSPELVSDLLPHVALIAILARANSGRLGSASSREHPGLVLVPEPQSGMEMAEALVHEGAHQKFFDLAITRSLIGPNHTEAPYFTPPWAPVGAPPWPLEQCFAAFHTYVLLGVLHRDVRAHAAAGDGHELPSHSLLPAAEQRAGTIGDWMVRQGVFLGSDGRTLVELLHGVRPPSSDAVGRDPRPTEDDLRDADLIRRCGRRTLVARAGSPIELYWLTTTVD